MMKVGITGQNGFIGRHLYNTLGLYPDTYTCVEFKKDFFDNPDLMDVFVSSCDVIVHLAAMNRHESQEVIYQTNVTLVQKLVDSLNRTNSRAHVIFSSSSQEDRDNLYGKSKKNGREILVSWANSVGARVTGLVIPNVFGPFGKPFYNSFIATFCYQLTHSDSPSIDVDSEVKLIYSAELVAYIRNIIDSEDNSEKLYVPHTTEIKVSSVLEKLNLFKNEYLLNGRIPELKNTFDVNLFNTFRSYIDLQEYFPVKFKLNTDPRGSFVEVIRLGVGGQVSFSTTVPGITRGNHFHTRKIERFAVIKGMATIEMRKIDEKKIYTFHLNGQEPSYVDMPVWYTHNITNTGEEDLYTIFWINELYNPDDADTFFVEV